jgi:hypothetical protein
MFIALSHLIPVHILLKSRLISSFFSPIHPSLSHDCLSSAYWPNLLTLLLPRNHPFTQLPPIYWSSYPLLMHLPSYQYRSVILNALWQSVVFIATCGAGASFSWSLRISTSKLITNILAVSILTNACTTARVPTESFEQILKYSLLSYWILGFRRIRLCRSRHFCS